MKHILRLLTLCVILASCGSRHTDATLESLETLVQEKPDSALQLIENFPKRKLGTKAKRALWSLLYATALDKNYIDTTDLDIIRPASDYYARHGSPERRMRAYFYQGRIYTNRSEDNRALFCYQKALADSARVNDNHYKDLVNSAISDIFSRSHNPDLEVKYSEDALRYARLAADSVGVWAITGHLASAYANQDRHEEAERTYQEFFAMPVYDTLRYYQTQLFYAKDIIRSPHPDSRRAAEIIENVAAAKPEAMTIEAYAVFAFAQQRIGNSTIANKLFRQLESAKEQQEIVKTWRYRTYKEQGRYKEALTDLEQTLVYQASVVISTLKQSTVQVQRDYFKAEADVLKSKNEIERQRLILLAVISTLIIGATVLFFRKRKATLDKRIEEMSALQAESQKMLQFQNEKAASVNVQIASKDGALFALRQKFVSLYKAQYKTLNELCATYLSPVKKDRKELIYDKVMEQLKVIVSDTASQDSFVNTINSSLDNIIDKLRKDLPNHKDQDFRFLAFIIAGFDATTIASLTGYSIGAVYTKKNRLKNEISALSSQYKDFYLQLIE